MFTGPDFQKKQILFVFFDQGDKLSFSNDNLVVKDKNGKIKCQCTCYRIFLVVAVGHFTITSPVIQKARKFGFFIALMTSSFKLYSMLGACKDGNTMLKRKQYGYNGLDIAKKIIKNKIDSQIQELSSVRNKNESIKEALHLLREYEENLFDAKALNELMAYEGLASKLYFRNHFNNVLWRGRQPRVKRDFVNSALDIGYTLLFAFIEALLLSFGFDTYCGVMHREFYMRQSLVCDIVEPFRVLIDHEIKKAINLGQIKEDDFIVQNHQFRLKWEESSRYVEILLKPLIKNKEKIFSYVQSFYRASMKGLPAEHYPVFLQG